MLRSDLRDFVTNKRSRAGFLLKIKSETDEYAMRLAKVGSSCPIHLQGTEIYEVSSHDIENTNRFLEQYPQHIRDYVLTAILLDEYAKKDEDTVDLLEELTAPEG